MPVKIDPWFRAKGFFWVAVVWVWGALPSVLGFGFVFGVLGVCPSLHKGKGRNQVPKLEKASNFFW